MKKTETMLQTVQEYDNKDIIRQRIMDAGGLITAAWCRIHNIPNTYLNRLHRDGEIEKYSPGIYYEVSEFLDTFYMFQLKYPKIVYSHETALYIHGQTLNMPHRWHVSVPNNYKFNGLEEDIKIHYRKKTEINIGTIEVVWRWGNVLRVHSFERVICDFLLEEKRIDPETFVSTLKNYAQWEKRDYTKLYQMAKHFKVEGKLHDYMRFL